MQSMELTGKRARLQGAAICLLLAQCFWLPVLASESAASSVSTSRAEQVVDELPGLADFVDGVVSPYLTKHRAAGVQVAVVKDGRVLLVKGYGIDAASPEHEVDPERSLFRLGSVSKTFTWVALMQLAERGQLQLEDPVNEHLPDSLRIPDEGFKAPIRIVDLMNHTAGFEDVMQGLFTAPDRQPLPLDEQLRKYRPHRVREPGRFMAYSNYSAALAGEIIAQVSGVDFQTYVERNILAPLAMSNTTFREAYAATSGLPAPMTPQLAENKAYGFEWIDSAWHAYPQEHITSMAPAGSAVSTAADMARYMMALLDPDLLERSGVLKRETSAKLREPTFQSAPGMPAIHHGFFDPPLANKTLRLDKLSHAGLTLHFVSNLLLVPDLAKRRAMERGREPSAQGSIGIFVTVNSGAGRQLVVELPERILTRYFLPPDATTADPKPVAQATAANLDEYAGQYRVMRRSYTGFEKTLSLPAVSTISAAPGGELRVELIGESPAQYVQIGKDLFQQTDGGATIAFARDSSGAVTHLLASWGALDRMGFLQSPKWMQLSVGAATLISLCVIIAAAWRRYRRARSTSRLQESMLERRSAQIMLSAAIAWLASMAAFFAWRLSMSNPQTREAAAFAYPQTSLKFALAVILVATVLMSLSTVSAVVIWRQGSWSVGRKVLHSIAAAVFAALIFTLVQWNAVGFQYF